MGLVSQLDHAAYRIVDEDLARVRDLGWSDAELIEAIWTTCVFNAVVRLVDAFGLTALFGQLAVTPAGSDRPGTLGGSSPPSRLVDAFDRW